MKKISQMKIPIATKIIGLTVSIVIGATALIAKQSSEYFKKVMIQREDYSNMSEANARSKEVENLLTSALDRGQALTNLLLTDEGSRTLPLQFAKEKNILSIELWKVTPQGFEFVRRQSNEEELKNLKLDTQSMIQVHQKIPFPMRSVTQKNIEIRNSTLDDRNPLITIGFPVGRDEKDMVRYVALLDLKMAFLQKPFSQESERSFYLLDRRGAVLAHQNEIFALKRAELSQFPIVQKALADSNPQRQLRFTDPETHAAFIGAYVKNSFLGVTVVAQTSEDVILEPAREVQRKAYYISGIVISVSLFLCFLFSMSLTGPLEKLAEMIEVVSKGNFEVKARSQVHSHDEVGDLAEAFDHMTEGLKERDKVKNLFSKFHGSSVAEDLIKNDIVVGGTKKEVTVFFSDIRGFTQFSEGHTPEEVVGMLNEYFGVMVKIINQRGGVVDKFIGDAIMAVWGAPHTSEDDTLHAIQAALEMRVKLNELNELRATRNQTPILIGMGIHCGPAISGTIGSEERMEYTVIGDTVNMTSRIEASTKAFGTDLLISEEAFQKTEKSFGFEFAGAAEVKGKTDALKLYKVLGNRSATGEVQEIRTPYSHYASEKADKVKIAV